MFESPERLTVVLKAVLPTQERPPFCVRHAAPYIEVVLSNMGSLTNMGIYTFHVGQDLEDGDNQNSHHKTADTTQRAVQHNSKKNVGR